MHVDIAEGWTGVVLVIWKTVGPGEGWLGLPVLHRAKNIHGLTYNRTENLMFQERFPEARQPNKSTVFRNYAKYQNHPSRTKGKAGRPWTARSEAAFAEFRAAIIRVPHQSKRRNNLGVTQTSFTRLVKDITFHRYKMQMRHGLSTTDPPRRLAYCQWFVISLG
jgi:hypothetical protein